MHLKQLPTYAYVVHFLEGMELSIGAKLNMSYVWSFFHEYNLDVPITYSWESHMDGICDE